MKKILISLMAIGLVVGLVGAGITAYFSDTETSSGNSFIAGTLDLKINGEDGIRGVTISNVAPGNNGIFDTIIVSNVGTISGTLTASVILETNMENGCANESESTADTAVDSPDGKACSDPAATGDLGYEVQVTVTDGTYSYTGRLTPNDLLLEDMNFGTLAGNTQKTITINYQIDNDADNDILGDSITFAIEFSLYQY